MRRSKTQDKDTGAWIYFGQVWYPHGVKPVLDNKFITEEGREMAIDEALGLHDKNEPQDVGDVFVPYTTDPAAAFQLALGIGAELAPTRGLRTRTIGIGSSAPPR